MTSRQRAVVQASIVVAIVALLLLLLRSRPAHVAPVPVPPTPAAVAPAAPRDAPSAAPSAASESPPLATPEAGQAPASAAPAATLRILGRVVDERKVGIEKVEVEIRAWSGSEKDEKWSMFDATSGADGAFEQVIDRSLASRDFGIATSAEGFVEGWLVVRIGEYDEATGVEVVAERARGVVGRIVDEYGRPIPKTQVQLWYGSETTWPTDVGADGRFRTPCRAPRKAFELLVEAPGYPFRTIAIPASADETADVGDIVFRRGGRVAGSVVDASGNPVPDLPLTLARIAGGSDKAPTTRTDGAGKFEFSDVGEGVVGVGVSIPGEAGPPGARRQYRGGIGDVTVGATDVRLVVHAEVMILLRFVDAATGKPVDVRKAEYGFRQEGAPEPENLGNGVSSTAPLLETHHSVWPGRYDLTVRSPGFEDADLKGVEVPDRAEYPLDVPMRRKP